MNLKLNWENYINKVISKKNYFFLTAQIYSSYKDIKKCIEKYCDGKLLDLGCGKMTYRSILSKYCQKYISLDKNVHHKDVDYIADINKMPFSDNEFDTIFCSQVFEHIPKPWQSIKEVARILKPGGTLIISVPHLCYLHGEPHDYYRYTKYGIEQIGKEADLKKTVIIASGGFLSFITTPFSIILLSLSNNIPVLNNIIFYCNKLFVVTIVKLDNLIDKNKIYCYNYIAIFKK